MNQTTFVDPSSTVPAADGGNTGNGTMSTPVPSSATLTENFTIVCTVPGGSGVGQFSVTGSVSGLLGTATSNAEFVDADQKVRFTLTAGGTPWAVSDEWTFSTVAGTVLNEANFDAFADPILRAIHGSFTTNSTAANGQSTGATITHGLGTDNVKVIMMAKGDTTPNDFLVMARRPDGAIAGILAGRTDITQTNAPGLPSSGDVRFTVKNGPTGTQTMTVFYTIIAEDL